MLIAFAPWFVFLFCGEAQAALFDAESMDIHAEIRAAGLKGRHLAIFFELPECAKCLKMKRRVFSDRRVETRFKRLYHTTRVNLASNSPLVDAWGKASTPRELAEKLRIFAVPSFAFFTPEGLLEYRHTGALTRPADFLLLGRFVSEAAYEKQPFSDYLRAFTPH